MARAKGRKSPNQVQAKETSYGIANDYIGELKTVKSRYERFLEIPSRTTQSSNRSPSQKSTSKHPLDKG